MSDIFSLPPIFQNWFRFSFFVAHKGSCIENLSRIKRCDNSGLSLYFKPSLQSAVLTDSRTCSPPSEKSEEVSIQELWNLVMQLGKEFWYPTFENKTKNGCFIFESCVGTKTVVTRIDAREGGNRGNYYMRCTCARVYDRETIETSKMKRRKKLYFPPSLKEIVADSQYSCCIDQDSLRERKIER